MKKLLCLLSLVVLAGCNNGYSDQTGDYRMPQELEGCKVFKLSDGNPLSSDIKVVVCPQYDCSSNTRYENKSTRNSTICY